MLDQNTDRMWYVIGALVVGAGIILLANQAMPEVFANVTESFNGVMNSTKNTLRDNFINESDIVWTNSNNVVSGFRSYDGSEVTTSLNQSVPQWDTNKATRVVTDGGGNILKTYIHLISISDQVIGRRYIVRFKIRNNQSNDITFHNNKSNEQVIKGNSSQEITAIGKGSTTSHYLLRFKGTSASSNLDFTIYDLKWGYIDE